MRRSLRIAFVLSGVLTVVPALVADSANLQEVRFDVPDGLQRAPQQVEAALDMQAAKLLRGTPYCDAVGKDAEARVYCDTTTSLPEAVLVVCRVPAHQTPPTVASLSLEEVRRGALEGGAQNLRPDSVDVRKSLVGRSRIPALEMSALADHPIAGPRRARVLMVPRRDFVLLVALDTAAEATRWDGAWDGLVATLDVKSPSPGTSSFPWHFVGIGAGIGLLVALFGLLPGRSTRVVHTPWKEAAAGAQAARPTVPLAIRVSDGLPTYTLGRRSGETAAAPVAVPGERAKVPAEPESVAGAVGSVLGESGSGVASVAFPRGASRTSRAPAEASTKSAEEHPPGGPDSFSLDPNARRPGRFTTSSGASLTSDDPALSVLEVPSLDAASAPPVSRIRRNSDFLHASAADRGASS